MFRRLLPLLALLALPLSASSAHAGTYTGEDPTGDVTGFEYSPHPRPCGSWSEVRHDDPRFNDITRLDVEHTATRVDLTLTLRDLPPLARSYQAFQVRTPDNAFQLTFSLLEGETVVFVDVEKPPPAEVGRCGTFITIGTSNPCRGAVGSVDKEGGTLAVSVPRRCLGAPPWVRVGAETSAGRHGYRDVWAPRGSKPSGPWGHVYGPRVRVAR